MTKCYCELKCVGFFYVILQLNVCLYNLLSVVFQLLNDMFLMLIDGTSIFGRKNVISQTRVKFTLYK